MENIEIILKLISVFLLSLLFGLERQKSHKPIGFGTFIFVSVGSCGLAISAIMLGNDNPLPLLGSIVTGIGFLGAGALIKTTDKIFGFTTAASIWVFSIFGLLVGVGNLIAAGMIYMFVWVIVLIDRILETNGIGSYQKRISIRTKKSTDDNIEKLFFYFGKFKLISLEKDKEGSSESYCYLVECSGKRLRKIIKVLTDQPWIISFKVE